MKIRFDSLFLRLSAMTIGLIVLVNLTAIFVVEQERGQIDTTRVQRDVLLAELAKHDSAMAALRVASTLGLSYIPANQAIAQGCPAPCTDTSTPFTHDLRPKLPPGSHIVSDVESGSLWIRYAGDPEWIRMENVTVPVMRFRSASLLMLAFAIAIALVGAWHLQRPLHRLALAAREFRIGRRVPEVRPAGPREVKELIADFNQMVDELAQSEQERAVMLAGVAHDLRAPITRMQVRADLLPDEANRAGFLRDAESLSRIVTQFLDFARESADRSPRVQVDAHCRRHYGDSLGGDALIALDLRADDGFALPLVDLDRILQNLIENALTYGEPPVEIATFRRGAEHVLSVRDHGGGIPADQLERALQPFVRLDEARSGDAHCGLGLAIVRRLVRYNGGSFAAFNCGNGGNDGGLTVEMSFPAG
ncbi:ATP-binding protein [Paraburkholderia phosphatilytica]|uniref:ATP-binding protein n=1 Tax=Paraburkholderia phosphatilytica TaxID=2282883 RepID=UPI000E4F0E48|nr:ATP-binding protein [Paraburkholderia phosphatilytica]